ncbi:hypothetical protein CYMTET_49326, partial [Cymbomonas tetramitiformis]
MAAAIHPDANALILFQVLKHLCMPSSAAADWVVFGEAYALDGKGAALEVPFQWVFDARDAEQFQALCNEGTPYIEGKPAVCCADKMMGIRVINELPRRGTRLWWFLMSGWIVAFATSVVPLVLKVTKHIKEKLHSKPYPKTSGTERKCEEKAVLTPQQVAAAIAAEASRRSALKRSSSRTTQTAKDQRSSEPTSLRAVETNIEESTSKQTDQAHRSLKEDLLEGPPLVVPERGALMLTKPGPPFVTKRCAVMLTKGGPPLVVPERGALGLTKPGPPLVTMRGAVMLTKPGPQLVTMR